MTVEEFTTKCQGKPNSDICLVMDIDCFIDSVFVYYRDKYFDLSECSKQFQQLVAYVHGLDCVLSFLQVSYAYIAKTMARCHATENDVNVVIRQVVDAINEQPIVYEAFDDSIPFTKRTRKEIATTGMALFSLVCKRLSYPSKCVTQKTPEIQHVAMEAVLEIGKAFSELAYGPEQCNSELVASVYTNIHLLKSLNYATPLFECRGQFIFDEYEFLYRTFDKLCRFIGKPQ